MKVLALSTVAGLVLLSACSDTTPTSVADPASATFAAANAAVHQYRVTLENLTTGQVFSPGVIATHTNKVSVWDVGAPASVGIQNIAEDGNELQAVTDLENMPGVFDVVDIDAPTNRIGGQAPFPTSRTFTISAAGNANRLSLAVMIICTNDGFTGVSSVKLPGGFKPDVHEVGAWDAGTEFNNQLSTHIVPPCGGAGPKPFPAGDNLNLRVAESGVIHPHQNILNLGFLEPALHGWNGPVARITIQRMK